jgi:hypothetical protein
MLARERIEDVLAALQKRITRGATAAALNG